MNKINLELLNTLIEHKIGINYFHFHKNMSHNINKNI